MLGKSFTRFMGLAIVVFAFNLAECQAVVNSTSAEEVEFDRFCPKGHSEENIVRIVYGYPGPGMMEDAQNGLIQLGGCVITGNDPKWFCQMCQSQWE